MKSAFYSLLVFGIALVGFVGCSTEGGFGQFVGSLAASLSGNGASDDGTTGDHTVADVASAGTTEPSAGQPLPRSATINVQVRNLSDKAADVTLRFLLNDVVVHLTLLRVPARSSSFVVGPDRADRVQAGGTDEDGLPLPPGDFVYGVDFDEGTIVVYELVGKPDEPSPGQDVPDDDTPSISMLEPADDVTVTVGSVVLVQWVDADADDNADIVLWLRPIGDTVGAAVQIAEVAEDPDGINDRLPIVIEGVGPGLYEVVGTIDDGQASAESVAPGRITVIEPEQNQAPTLEILQPATGVTVFLGESLFVEWIAEDDGAAFVTFYLDANGISFDEDDIQISAPLAVDPDGADNDSAWFGTTGVPPGTYHLLGVINDGELISTARAAGMVIVRQRPPGPSPSPGPECNSNGDCDDGLFCNGAEYCSDGKCYDGEPPCGPDQVCDEDEDFCYQACQDDPDCDDEQFCNGAEYCSDGRCYDGEPPCDVGQYCDEEADTCGFVQAFPAVEQPSEVVIGDLYCLTYYMRHYQPDPTDVLRFYLDPLDTGLPEVEVFTPDPIDVTSNSFGEVCVDTGPADPTLIDCSSTGYGYVDVYLELRLERTSGQPPDVIASTRVQWEKPASPDADVVIMLMCPYDLYLYDP